MTNFEKVTESVEALERFLEEVQDDALEAEGCSMKLKMPDPEICMLWGEWLKKEAEG